jgi:hypothetical protein
LLPMLSVLLLILRPRINLETGEQTVLSAHEAPVRSVVYNKELCKLYLYPYGP